MPKKNNFKGVGDEVARVTDDMAWPRTVHKPAGQCAVNIKPVLAENYRKTNLFSLEATATLEVNQAEPGVNQWQTQQGPQD